MKIGCKKGVLCSDINKEYCCLECSDFNTCKEPCLPLINGETRKEHVLEFCSNAIDLDA